MSSYTSIEERVEGIAMRRREFLTQSCATLAGGAFGLRGALCQAAEFHAGHPLAPKRAHHVPQAERLLVVFLTGGFSHVDTFDYKPKLAADSGKVVPGVHLRGVAEQPLLGSPFRFAQHGESGLWMSELFPHLATCADDLCVVRSLHTDIVEHFQAVLAMHTGSATVPLPSLGCWLSHGLGTCNSNLPSYVVLCEHLPYAGAQVWDNSFLPADHQGVRVIPGKQPIADLAATTTSTLAELEARMLHDLNREHANRRGGDAALTARDRTFDTARGLMNDAPEILEIAHETPHTLRAYGLEPGERRSFAYQCLLSRRLLERGVRVVELIDTGSGDNWDAHGDMQNHVPKAQRVDQPLAALLTDLKQRGLLDETLVVICTEFGRTPWTDGPQTKGRNHYARAFSSILAGGGVRGGITYGQTDEYGIEIVDRGCHVHDFHATILHLMGIDHTRLTYRYAGRDYRLTDVHGEVMRDVLA
jgi:uncharacterized protein (DUF1501 family)